MVNTRAIDITDSEFSSNFSAGKGGAIQLENGANLTVIDTVFNGNTTNYWGGAIRILGADATISVTKDISMTGNKANVNGLMSASYSDMGGFAYLQGNSKLTLAGENGATLMPTLLTKQSTLLLLSAATNLRPTSLSLREMSLLTVRLKRSPTKSP